MESMSTNLVNYLSDFKEFSKDTNPVIMELFKDSVDYCINKIIDDTPVYAGNSPNAGKLKASWTVEEKRTSKIKDTITLDNKAENNFKAKNGIQSEYAYDVEVGNWDFGKRGYGAGFFMVAKNTKEYEKELPKEFSKIYYEYWNKKVRG